jgi:adenylosuccinate lyase
MEVICPLDDRYRNELLKIGLLDCFNEKEYIKNRYLIELYYLNALLKFISHEDYNEFEIFFTQFDKKFTDHDFEKIKLIERTTNHDVKSIEIYLREKIPEKFQGYIHFGLTSQDVNSLGFMIGFIKLIQILKKTLFELENEIEKLIMRSNNIVMCAKTHVQFAVPTFLDKEIYFKYFQIHKYYERLNNYSLNLTCKMGGAIGNLNAHNLCFPNLDWNGFFDNFIDEFTDIFFLNNNSLFEKNKINIKRSYITTQIDDYTSICDILQCMKDILLSIDCYNSYCYSLINDEYFVQSFNDNHVGSSTMPQKINPIDFENAKGNNSLSVSLIDGIIAHLRTKITYQRDISDSTIIRNIPTVFGYTILTINKITKGTILLNPNIIKIKNDLDNNPQIIMEGIQSYLKLCGINDSYEKAKKLSRGKKININDIYEFIDLFEISNDDKIKLKSISPSNYTGIKPKITLFHNI